MTSNQSHHNQSGHQPVLLDALLRLLVPQKGERYLDLTAGYGGHARAILDITGAAGAGDHVLIDRDEPAAAYLREYFGAQARVLRGAYTDVLPRQEQFDLIVGDLGVSSPQLDDPERGFSFRAEADLDMRMDRRQDLRAADIINHTPEAELANIIYRYGEERQSRRIARAIVEARPFRTTTELADVVKRVYRGRSRIHPATRTFQALRIAVNDELGQLERALPLIEPMLAPGGRLAVISFHSLEDRIVKQFFRDSPLATLHKNVVQGKYEDVSNPRARSAKLRVAMKNTNGHTIP